MKTESVYCAITRIKIGLKCHALYAEEIVKICSSFTETKIIENANPVN